MTITDTQDATDVVLTELAPAKINLGLHVVGLRYDGFHLLESIVTFADLGDQLTFKLSETDEFSVSGRFASELGTDQTGNLVVRARDLFRQQLISNGFPAPPVSIHLEKQLPISAGVGGGSADAAATLRGLFRLWNAEIPEAALLALGLSLGADVPMCLTGAAILAEGIGERLEPLPTMPSLFLVLANPLISVSTPQIYAQLADKENEALPAPPTEAKDWLTYLKTLRNDLEPPARALIPEIAEISAMIAAEGADLVRMSGSGATCFGVFPSRAAAEAAVQALASQKPDWYFAAVETVGAKP
ncbi:4-(cytidine 5'-diphospho)-2-C-methyl-D-erythritol kinase [Rhizobium sp. NFR12]|uniref:4-(cytidine 5'-diphospho)-2-C-methyl-D-erythritol kinase n=1 Tax=Rhizobium sp. NFR12 TaxID=1566261 RepID=UPI0008A74DE9|nr:4-(cytidine 5'-diphospho)-2-C-methyl-D-erythritol kinase [Rhizobium sp. NFR12]SEH23690.1 4-diphosphocytidyl-2-C-methyl-D-erythritol kinase [Rhizobium sp. NFR12]